MTPLTLVFTGFIAGVLIGLNPVLISSFTAYISSMIGRKTTNNRYTSAGFLFIFYLILFLTFFSAAIGSFVSFLSADYQLAFGLVVAVASVVIGIALIRRYFWHEPLINPPKEVSLALHDKTTKKRGLINVIGLTLVVVYATLPTIGIAIAILATLGALTGPGSLIWSISFIFGVITPIYAILALLSNGTRVSSIVEWKERTKSTMRLYSGLAIVALAWLLLYIIAGGELLVI